ncbi:MAG: EAL domain-containing protein [Selenomonadaceae bacterium]|nr:EAL domain-containing protein [Selenomonadaceae bacterium]
MKKIFCLLMILFSICNNVSAETKLRVGYIPSFGFLEEDRAGHIRGYGYEYMEFLARYGGWKFEYVPGATWNELGEKLQAGTIDILPAMPGDYRSLKNVIRTEHVVGRYVMELVTHNGEINSHMRIGTISTNPPMPSLPVVAKNEGFTYELVIFNSFYDMEESFERRELDGYIGPMLEPNKEKNVAAIFDRQSYRILVRPDRKDLLAALNIAMDEMLMDQPNIRNRLNDKYLRTGGSPLILTRQERDYLAQKKKLRTAILMFEKPYAYKINGELHGIIPNLIKKIADDLKIEIEIVETNSSVENENLIKQGKIDFAADVICDFSWAEKLGMAPTQSYLNLDYVSVTRRGSELNSSPVVACAPDLLYTRNFVFPLYPEEKRLYFENLEECFKAVSEGRADILYAPRSEVSYIIEDTGSYNLAATSESLFTDSLSLGVSLSADPKLWRILNKAVNHLDERQIYTSFYESIDSSNNLSLQWQLYHHPLRVVGFMLILAGLLGSGIFYRMYRRKKHLKFIQHIAYTDRRYQIPNLSLLEEELPKIFAKYKEEEENLYVMTFNIDREVNKKIFQDKELQGRQIKNMAENLDGMNEIILTAINSENDGLVSLCRGKNISDAARLAREVVRKISFMETQGSRVWIYIKVGICTVEEENILDCVESAQTACRNSTKDVAIFDSQMAEEINFEKKIISRMEDALKNGEFQAWYQTEYDIETHKQTGMEAFVRWQSSDLGFLMPEKFLRIFERNGFITKMDYFMVEEVFKLQKKNLDEGKKILPIAVNQSGLHMAEENYLDKMKKLVKKYNLPNGSIKLEFSEKFFEGVIKAEQETRIANIFQSLHNFGFKISIDNFGAGRSSYKLLNHLNIDELKIDRSLLYSATNSERMQNILENVISLGKNLDMVVICEGIETKEQENLLLKLGCKFGQGFRNSELLSAEEF